MKMTLKVSVLLNLILLGVMMCLWMSPRGNEANPTPSAQRKVEPPVRATVPSESVRPVLHQKVASQSFRWSQLLAGGSYQAFVANLRAAGCPEPTVEDIVRGDAERAFLKKRTQLGIDGSEPGLWSDQAQMQLVASLLGQTPASPKDTVASSPGTRTTEAATMTAFLQSVDLTAHGQDDEQKREIASLRQTLLEQISGANQAPNIPNSTSSEIAVNSRQSPLAGTGGTQLSPSATGNTISSQAGANTSQSSQTAPGMDSSPVRWRPQVNQSLFQAAEAESVLGGLFGMGAAIKYDQYRIEHAGQQQP